MIIIKRKDKGYESKHADKDFNRKRSAVITLAIVFFCVLFGGTGLYFSDEIANALTLYKVTVNYEGEPVLVQDRSVETVADFLEFVQYDVEKTDIVEPGLEEVLVDGMTVTVTKTIGVSLTADKKTTELRTAAESTVSDLLTEQGVELGEKDKVSPAADEKLKDGDKVKVVRVTTKTVTEEEETDYSVTEEETKSLYEGDTQVKTEGQNGLDKVTYKVTYEDGKEVSRKEKSREVVSEPQEEVVLVGIKKAEVQESNRGSSKSEQNDNSSSEESSSSESSGQTINGSAYSSCLTCTATAYTYTGNKTACGTEPGYGTVAVDPGVIPLYSNLYIEGYGYGQALDTGGAINGNIIDVFMESESECYNWGRRSVMVYILI